MKTPCNSATEKFITDGIGILSGVALMFEYRCQPKVRISSSKILSFLLDVKWNNWSRGFPYPLALLE